MAIVEQVTFGMCTGAGSDACGRAACFSWCYPGVQYIPWRHPGAVSLCGVAFRDWIGLARKRDVYLAYGGWLHRSSFNLHTAGHSALMGLLSRTSGLNKYRGGQSVTTMPLPQ